MVVNAWQKFLSWFRLPERACDKLLRAALDRGIALERELDPMRAEVKEGRETIARLQTSDVGNALKEVERHKKVADDARKERDAFSVQIRNLKMPVSFDGLDIVTSFGGYGRILRCAEALPPSHESSWTGLEWWDVHGRWSFVVVMDGTEQTVEVSVRELIDAVRRAQQKGSWLNVNRV